MGKDISLKFYPDTYIVLDIETTGLSPLKNEIIELSAIKIVDGEVFETFSRLVKPEGRVSYFISNLTGITNEMLKNADNIESVLSDFKEFVSSSIIMGHNVKFDIRFLDYNFRKYLNLPFSNDYIDTLRIARCFLNELKSHKLGLLAEYFEFNNDGMHRALKDCHVTNLCYRKFFEMQKCQELQLK